MAPPTQPATFLITIILWRIARHRSKASGGQNTYQYFVQVFHTDDGGEADKNICKAVDGTPISQQEAAKQETLGKAATLLEQACISYLSARRVQLECSVRNAIEHSSGHCLA